MAVCQELEEKERGGWIYVICSICGLAAFRGPFEPRRVFKNYDLVEGAPFCHGCRDTFEAKVWRASQ